MSTCEMIRHRFSVEQYHRMIDAGIFAPDDRLELIHGELIKMSPINRRHAACCARISYLLERLGRRAMKRIQDPITLTDSEPQPDVAIVRWRDDFYLAGHPTPPDIYWVIEVADTNIAYDREVKVPLYMQAGIPEVWLVIAKHTKVDMIWVAGRSPTLVSYSLRGVAMNLKATTLTYLAITWMQIA
jgi:Uma2 family endonuclease